MAGIYLGLLRKDDSEHRMDDAPALRCDAHPNYTGKRSPEDRHCITCAKIWNHTKMKGLPR